MEQSIHDDLIKLTTPSNHWLLQRLHGVLPRFDCIDRFIQLNWQARRVMHVHPCLVSSCCTSIVQRLCPLASRHSLSPLRAHPLLHCFWWICRCQSLRHHFKIPPLCPPWTWIPKGWTYHHLGNDSTIKIINYNPPPHPALSPHWPPLVCTTTTMMVCPWWHHSLSHIPPSIPFLMQQ